MTMATPLLFQKREDVYDYGHPSLASKRGKMSMTMPTPSLLPEEGEEVFDHDHSLFSSRRVKMSMTMRTLLLLEEGVCL